MKRLYNILKRNSDVQLEGIVQEFLDHGWELQGGVSVLSVGDCYQFFQAIVIDVPGDEDKK